MEDLISRRDITIQAIKYLGLKVKGSIYPSTDEVMVRCPIHGGPNGDKNPSCGISLDKGIYNCFACGSHGNIESLFKQITGEDLYKTLGIQNDPFSNWARNYDYWDKEAEEFTGKVDPLHIDFTCDLSQTIPAYNNPLSRDYLKSRGITSEVSSGMNIRYSDSIMIMGKEYVKRILIPIYEKGKLISVEARRIEDNDEPKVLYPRGSSVNTLYDIDNLNINEPVYCTEGLMDMAVLRGCKEFKNSTTIFGATLTNRQKQLISTFKQFVYIPDNDDVGLKVLEKLSALQTGNIYYLKVPTTINGIAIKDVGDLPKARVTSQSLYDKKWTKYIKYLN